MDGIIQTDKVEGNNLTGKQNYDNPLEQVGASLKWIGDHFDVAVRKPELRLATGASTFSSFMSIVYRLLDCRKGLLAPTLFLRLLLSDPEVAVRAMYGWIVIQRQRRS